MKLLTIRRALATAAFGVVLVGAVACGSQGGTASTGSSGAATSPTAAAAAQPAASTVSMKDVAFDPQSVTVKVGTTVTWKNTSSAPHTVTADNATFDSGQDASQWIQPGKEFSFTFDKPGTYTYFCAPHKAAGMTGTVVVE